MPKTTRRAGLNQTTSAANNQSSLSSRNSTSGLKKNRKVTTKIQKGSQEVDDKLTKLELILQNCNTLTCSVCQLTSGLNKFFIHFDQKSMA